MMVQGVVVAKKHVIVKIFSAKIAEKKTENRTRKPRAIIVEHVNVCVKLYV